MSLPPDDSARIENALFERVPSTSIALIDGDRSLSYAELCALVDRFARALVDAGVRPGDRVALLAPKSIELVAALYATWVAGAVVVPIHTSLKSRQVEHIVLHSGARCIVTNQNALSALEPRVYESLSIVDLDERSDVVARCPSELDGGDALAAILYTSGSTGRPKGIAVSHANLIAGARIVSGYLSVDDADRILSVLPFSFDYGLNQLLIAVARGATLVIQRSHHPVDICGTLEQHEVTLFAAVPPLWLQLMGRLSPFSRMELPKLRAITNSGGALPVDLTRRVRASFPHVAVFPMYGLSEAFRSTYLDPVLVDERPESIGRAIPETEIFVVDADGCECADDEVGELVHVGPTVALGYWNDADATAEVFRETKLRPGARAVFSGDLVRRAADGLLTFVGRRDALIKSLGFRVSPDEVEEILYESSQVAEAMVRSDSSSSASSSIVAVVVPNDPRSFDADALLAWCREQMPRYMVPVELIVRDELPRTSTGKLDRRSVA